MTTKRHLHDDTKDGKLIYVAPQTAKEYIFDPILEGYTASGDKEKEKDTVIKILQKGSILGIGYLGAVASLLITPLEDVGARNFIVFFEGKTGSGKTTSAQFGLSLFGNPSKLRLNMNITKAAAEIILTTRKDSLVLLDEIMTMWYSYIPKHLKEVFYDFVNGIGRTKKNSRINLRQPSIYRGVLFLTSEISFEKYIRKTDETLMGIYRSNVIVDFSNQEIDREGINIIYESIYKNHGNLLKDITDYIRNNIDFLKERYIHHRKQLARYKFNGQENHFALLYCAIDVLENVLDTDFSTAKNSMKNTLDKIVEENTEDYKKA